MVLAEQPESIANLSQKFVCSLHRANRLNNIVDFERSIPVSRRRNRGVERRLVYQFLRLVVAAKHIGYKMKPVVEVGPIHSAGIHQAIGCRVDLFQQIDQVGI